MEYIFQLLSAVPTAAVVILCMIFVIGSVLVWHIRGWYKGAKLILLLFLVEYIVYVLMSTVFFRGTPLEGGIKLMPFWSYFVADERHNLMMENVMNLIVFVPIGFICGLCIDKVRWVNIFLGGLALSATIEILQLSLNRGLCEFDDLMHNTVGCLIGYGMIVVIKRFCKI